MFPECTSSGIPALSAIASPGLAPPFFLQQLLWQFQFRKNKSSDYVRMREMGLRAMNSIKVEKLITSDEIM